MKVTLWMFTGGSNAHADEITSQVFVTKAEAEAAEVEWLADNDDDEYPTWFGWVEQVEIDYPI